MSTKSQTKEWEGTVGGKVKSLRVCRQCHAAAGTACIGPAHRHRQLDRQQCPLPGKVISSLWTELSMQGISRGGRHDVYSPSIPPQADRRAAMPLPGKVISGLLEKTTKTYTIGKSSTQGTKNLRIGVRLIRLSVLIISIISDTSKRNPLRGEAPSSLSSHLGTFSLSLATSGHSLFLSLSPVPSSLSFLSSFSFSCHFRPFSCLQ